jgi:ComEC/Rec2-related protein
MKQPAVKYLSYLALGIITGHFLQFPLCISLILSIIVLIVLVLSLKLDYLQKSYPLLVIITGLILFQSEIPEPKKNHDHLLPEFGGFIKGRVDEILSSNSKVSKYLVTGYLRTELGELKDKTVLLSVSKVKDNKQYLIADSILANVKLRFPQKLTLDTDFDEVSYSRSLGFVLYAYTDSGKVASLSRGESILNFFYDFNGHIKNRLKSLFTTSTYPLITALITGDKSELDYSDKKAFSITGTTHVLAVSGLHIGIISGFLLILFSWVRNQHIRFLMFALLLSFYVVLTGIQPSAVRAAVMSLLIFIVYLNQRHFNLLNIVSYAVIIIVVISPDLISSIGFQLSAGALVGISIFISPAQEFFSRMFKSISSIVKLIISSLSITIAVSIVVSPIVAFYFGTYSAISPLANLIVVPLTSLAMIFGIISLIISLVSMPLALIYSAVALQAIEFTNQSVLFLSNIPNAQLNFNEPVMISIGITIALIYLIYSKSVRQSAFRLVFSIIVIIGLVMIIDQEPKSSIKIHPRQHSVFVEINSGSRNYLMILDRKPFNSRFKDKNLYNYIDKKRNNPTLLINGNTGIHIVDMLKEKGPVKYFELKEADIRDILRILNLNTEIFRNTVIN